MTNRSALPAFIALVAFTGLSHAETRLVEANGETGYVSDRAHLRITGQITDRDAKAVAHLIGPATKASGFSTHGGSKRPVVFLDSPGGDAMAAMRIGRNLRKNVAWVWVDKGAECASACVFILASGVERNIATGARVLLHRPYFSPRFFAELSPTNAQQLYRKLADMSKEYLKDMGMPDSLFERMLRVPSQKAELLSLRDLENLRLEGSDPAFEEWNRANAEKSLGGERLRQMEGFTDCLNSGAAQEVCEKRWKLKLGD
jgi:ATP-dependent protease ClpP protease subunit